MENTDVLLISMPFGNFLLPSLALTLLKAAVKKKGYSTTIKYFSLKFTNMLGERTYNLISSGIPVYHYLLGEWLFSGTLFDNLPPDEEYIKEVLNANNDDFFKYDQGVGNVTKELKSLLLEIKPKTEPYINSCLEEVLLINPKIVGFTSSFQQNIASLSLAKRIKEKLPETIIVFGGANCEGEMGLEIIKKFSFVDIIVSGEADEIFPELVSKIINKEEYKNLPGVICQQNLDTYFNDVNNSPMITNMDSLPIPDYDDYFQELKNYNIKSIFRPVVLFESSRGCWWGEKSHCTFCGLNGNNMFHRSKSASRAIDEIKFLKDKYKVSGLVVTDNILDLAYFKDFIPALAKENLELGLFYEVKANLTKEQLLLLKAANITFIQPGVESFSTHVLDLMKKGVKSIQNVQLLKWCKELNITPLWNFIWGFPGETKEDYDEMATLFPKISHLMVPRGASKLRLDRFSPNFNFPDKFGIKNFYPFSAYKYIYPFEEDSINKLAYFFDYEYEKCEKFDSALENVIRELERWKTNQHNVGLFFVDKETALVIFDLRLIANNPYYILNNKERFIYLFCDKIQTLAKIKREYSQYFNLEVNDIEVNDILVSLTDKNLMIRENNSFLSLAIPFENYSQNKNIMAKLLVTLRNRPGNDQVKVTDKGLLIQLSV